MFSRTSVCVRNDKDFFQQFLAIELFLLPSFFIGFNDVCQHCAPTMDEFRSEIDAVPWRKVIVAGNPAAYIGSRLDDCDGLNCLVVRVRYKQSPGS